MTIAHVYTVNIMHTKPQYHKKKNNSKKCLCEPYLCTECADIWLTHMHLPITNTHKQQYFLSFRYALVTPGQYFCCSSPLRSAYAGRL